MALVEAVGLGLEDGSQEAWHTFALGEHVIKRGRANGMVSNQAAAEARQDIRSPGSNEFLAVARLLEVAVGLSYTSLQLVAHLLAERATHLVHAGAALIKSYDHT